MAVKTDPKLDEHFANGGPGAHLRRAREAANMSIADVADALFLHPNKIEALESDTFDHLTSPTFVRGYLRGYARVLGLPSAPILEMYDRQGFRPPPLAPEVSETKQAHTSDLPIRLVTWAVGAVLVLLVGLWWRSQGDNGFDIGDDLLGWWSDATFELPFPEAEAPAPAPASSPAEGPAPAGFPPDTPAPAGSDAGGRTVAMAPDRAGGPPHQGGESPASPPAGGPAPADIPPDAPVPDGSDAGGRTVAMAPDRAGGPPQGDEPPASSPAGGPAPADIPSDAPVPDGSDAGGRTVAMALDRTGVPPEGDEPPVFSPAGGPAPTDIPSDAPAPDGSDAGGRTVAMAPDRAGGPPQGGESPASSPAEGPAIAGTGPAPVDGAGRPEAPEPRDTRQADATDGPDATAAPGAVTPPSIPETSPPETDSTPSDVAAVATAVAEAAQSGLVLAFAHESWVEVFDRERNRLFFGLVQPGRVLDFDGPRPFDVLLGNSNDVRVTIDGEAFDHTPYVRHGVARFSVGASPAGRADAAEPSDTVATDADDSRETPPQPRDGNAR